MPHMLITGTTTSGKTTLAKRLSEHYSRMGFKVIVLDPMGSAGWAADFQTSNRDAFIETVENSRRCMVFIDEAGEMVGQYGKEMFFLASRARHLGHTSHFITQRPKQLSPTVRDNCVKLAMFNTSRDACKILASEFNKAELANGHALKQGEYFYCSRFGDVKKARVF